MSVGTTSTGNHFVQYRVPGFKSPRKEYFGKGESGKGKAEIRQEEIRAGEVVTMESLAGRQIYLDELAQLYINYVKIFKGKKTLGKRCRWLTEYPFLALPLPCAD